MTNRQFWLYRRLGELGKTRQDLAEALNISVNRFSEMEKQRWKLRVEHIPTTAKVLEFDKTALLDFLCGAITEDQLWKSKPFVLTDQDKAILNAVKSMVGLQKQATDDPDTSKQVPISNKERE